MRAALFGTVLALSVLGGCVQRESFQWGSYDQSLLEYYQDTGNLDKLMAELDRLSVAYETGDLPELNAALEAGLVSSDRGTRRQAVMQVDAANKSLDQGPKARLAPGLMGELGYLNLQAGNVDKAASLFQREKRLWPESAYFMDVMAQLTKGAEAQPGADAKAIQAEAARQHKAEKTQGNRK